MEPNCQPVDAEDDEIDLLDLWDILAQKWLWIVTGTGLSAIIAVAVAFLMTPIYRSEVVLVSADDSGGKGGVSALAAQFGGLADLTGVNLGGGGKSEAVAVLKSNALKAGFVKDNQLMPVLFDDKWDASSGKWKEDDPKKIPTLNRAVELLTKDVVNISEDKKTGVITLAVEWKDRTLAAAWANDLVRRSNDIIRTRAIDEAQRTIDFLHQESKKTSVVEIQQTIYRLLEANYKTVSTANAREQYAFKVVDPAVPADENRRARPKRALIVILATLAGAFLSILAVFVHRGIADMKARRARRLAQ